MGKELLVASFQLPVKRYRAEESRSRSRELRKRSVTPRREFRTALLIEAESGERGTWSVEGRKENHYWLLILQLRIAEFGVRNEGFVPDT